MTWTRAELVDAVVGAFPYSNQAKEFDIDSESEAIRFTWRGERLRISSSGSVEECKDGCLCGSNLALLAEQIVKRKLLEMFVAKK